MNGSPPGKAVETSRKRFSDFVPVECWKFREYEGCQARGRREPLQRFCFNRGILASRFLVLQWQAWAFWRCTWIFDSSLGNWKISLAIVYGLESPDDMVDTINTFIRECIYQNAPLERSKYNQIPAPWMQIAENQQLQIGQGLFRTILKNRVALSGQFITK